MIVDLAARYPDDWIGQFADEDAAVQELKEIRRGKEQIANAPQLRFAYVDKPEPSLACPQYHNGFRPQVAANVITLVQ